MMKKLNSPKLNSKSTYTSNKKLTNFKKQYSVKNEPSIKELSSNRINTNTDKSLERIEYNQIHTIGALSTNEKSTFNSITMTKQDINNNNNNLKYMPDMVNITRNKPQNNNKSNKTYNTKSVSVPKRSLRQLHTNQSVNFSRNKQDSITYNLSKVNMSFEENIRYLENMIKNIKFNGFEKNKLQIDERLLEKQALEASIDKLQKDLNFITSQKKKFGTKNTVIEAKTIQLFNNQEVFIYLFPLGTRKTNSKRVITERIYRI